MATFDFTRLKRLMLIYRVVQAVLFALLVFMAFSFQKLFKAFGNPEMFIKGIAVAVVVQLLMLYPVWLLARRDVLVDVDASATGIAGDQMMALRKRRLIGDLIKLCMMGFFAVFVLLAPGVDKGRGAALVLEGAYFSFLLVTLTYFQCFNIFAKRKMTELK